MGVLTGPAALRRSLRTGGTLTPQGRRWLTGYALCLPALLVVFGMLAYPIAKDVGLSLTDAHGFEYSGRFIGLANYDRLARDPLFWEGARNTLVLVGGTAVVEMAVGLLTALLLWWKFWGRAIVFLAVFVPWAFPSSFSGFTWYWLLSPPFHTFYTVHLLDARFWLEGIFGRGAWAVLSLLIMNVWRGSSIIAILLLAGLNGIPEALLDYGRLESPNRWRYFWQVVTPLYWRFFAVASLIAVVITYMDVIAMYVETGGRILVPLIGTLSFQQAILVGNAGYGAALVLTQIPIFLLLGIVGLRLVDRVPASRVRDHEHWTVERTETGLPASLLRRPAEIRPSSNKRADWWRRRSRVLATLGVMAALAVMVFHLFPLYYTGVQAVRPTSELARGNMLWAYNPDWTDVVTALHNQVYLQWGVNTLWVYGAVLGLGLTMAMAAGYSLARFRPPGARRLARLLFVSYFVPQMAVALPVFQIFQPLGLDNTIPGIVLLYLTLIVPFTTWLFYAYFLGLDPEVEEQAWLDGRRLQAFWHIVLPMSWPILIACALFAVGMMGSDLLYGPLFTLSNTTKTLPVGLGLTAIDLDEWANVNAAILLSALPIVVTSAALGRYYVRGLQSALVEGS